MDAMISGRGGLALVVEGDRLASIHASEPETMTPRHRNEVHFLLGEARDFVTVEDVSREEIVRQLMLAKNREHALQLTLIQLDHDLPGDIRRGGAVELEELFEQEDLVVYVESVLYAKPLPDDSDLPGSLRLARDADALKVAATLGKLEASQPVIADVRRAWDAIPAERFGSEEKRWQFVAVREGLFRQLVLHRMAGKDANAFFVSAATHPVITSMPASRQVLRAWTAPFLERYMVHEDWARVTEQPQVVREGYGGQGRSGHEHRRKLATKKKLTAIREPYTKAKLISAISEDTGLTRKEVARVFDSLGDYMHRHLKKRACGTFTLPGLARFSVRVKKAAKAYSRPNPFKPDELIEVPAKTARRIVRVRVLRGLKDMAESK